MNRSLFFIIIIASFCCFTQISAQVPVLGSASGYVLYSSTGAVGNTGATSQFTGDIGTFGGAITIGVNVNGVLHNADANAIATSAAVLLAYQQIQQLAPTDTQFGTISYSLGNKDTLVAGVDSIALNTQLNDTLILDGQNNAASVFVFKINGTLTSNSLSAVKLINGALACNVFWQVNGAITISANTTLRGTFIANSAAINLGSGTVLEGRMLTSTAGAIATTNVLTYLPTGCGSMVLTGPPAPILGTASCYTLFTGNGANSNSGNTNVIGDIGTNVGLTTGYDPLLVAGMIHPNPDVSTAACSADLLIAYTYLNTLVPDIELLYPASFGQNLVLTPHTYLLNAATALTDTLYLNAEGDSNAVFVMQINGALSTSTFATVILINGALSKNVFWKVDGATTISDYSIFKGTIIGNNGAINLNTGVNLEGRALTTNGAFIAAAITATVPPFSCSLVLPLPMSLVSFNGRYDGKKVLLQWEMKNSFEANEFLVEKSTDARNFSTIASIKVSDFAAQANQETFSATDYQPGAVNYYRIGVVGTNGFKDYSKIVQVNGAADGKQTFLPYVDDNNVNFTYAAGKNQKGVIKIFSTDGQKIGEYPVALTETLNNYRVVKPIQAGIYTVLLESAGLRLAIGRVSVD